MSKGIVFQVETSRVLEILAKEIYDSPLALLRENVQNAYDAVRMRFAKTGTLTPGGWIRILVENGEISISDNGIGMSERVLRDNFWKPGSSGRHSNSAKVSGVVGTFGIGAMANFGVCTKLTVETREEGSQLTLISSAKLETLSIGEECISFDEIVSTTEVGTKVTAILENPTQISPDQAKEYLKQYVAHLPVPVYFNDTLISSNSFDLTVDTGDRTFEEIGTRSLTDGFCSSTFVVMADSNGQIFVKTSDITFGGTAVEGAMTLVQQGGQLMGLRSYFGLAPVPTIGNYQFGGIANLSFLHPTAGREALSRDSIEQVTRLINLAERAASELLSNHKLSNRNNAFLQWITSHGKYDLAGEVTVRILPNSDEISLSGVKDYIGSGSVHYYRGVDLEILSTFAGEGLFLIQLSQSNPRQNVQLQYIANILSIPEVPLTAEVRKEYSGSELSIREAAIVIRVASILRDDYLISDTEVILADISHKVAILAQLNGSRVQVYIERSHSFLSPLYECYERAYELFTQFMKDFVRVNIYPKVQQFVPSSTRDGVDALRRILQRNRELYRYEQDEFGDMEGVLGDLLSGSSSFSEVLHAARSSVKAQTQSVTSDQVGSVEQVLADVVASPVAAPVEQGVEFSATPPILRESIASDMKILTTDAKYPALNNFSMLLGLSDRLMRTEADFFRTPHTTRILWGGHRVVYIFTESTGRLSLYYDIELKDPISKTNTGGGMFQTTTVFTKKRIFVPVPDLLAHEFKIGSGAKEFFVRFDLLSSDIT